MDTREQVWLNAYCTSLSLDRHASVAAKDADNCLAAFEARFKKSEEKSE